MLMKYAPKQMFAHELWEQYKQDLACEGQNDTSFTGWAYGQFDNGESIPAEARRMYRSRPDLQTAFPNPYSTLNPSYLCWWHAENARITPMQQLSILVVRRIKTLIKRGLNLVNLIKGQQS